MRRILLFVVTMLCGVCAIAQDAYNERARKYIEQYATMAQYEQLRSGVPASITLGQGILETEAGASELMVEANNHFGIKCGIGWTGLSFSHTDDAPNECFKKYGCAADSYRDHSDHLHRNQRYAPLFGLQTTDYSGWAKCLKRCGYATNPRYAERLIQIIEEFKLQDYTISAMDSSFMRRNTPVMLQPQATSMQPGNAITAIGGLADSAHAALLHPAHVVTPAHPAQPPAVVKPLTPVPEIPATAQSQATFAPTTRDVIRAEQEESRIVIINGLKAFYALKDEMLLKYAMRYHVGYQQLLFMNDLKDAPLPFNMHVYLEHKLTRGLNAQHIVREGESLQMAAQAEGMQLKTIMELNQLTPNEEPLPGSLLELQVPARHKPAVASGQTAAHSHNAIQATDDRQNSSDYIVINKPAARTFADTARPAIAASPAVRTAPLTTAQAAVYPVPAHALPAPVKPVAAPAQPLASTVVKPAAAAASKYYTVVKGDTAFSIAKRNNITVEQLADWNDLTANQIKVGQTLQIKE